MPSRIGRYVVRRRIGSGGFATVWLAYDEQLDSPVAVKVLAENWTEDHHVRQRFLEEGRFLRKVESPHVVTVYDAGELDDGRPYLVMSYADQGTLADRLEIDGLTPAQALEVVRQIGLGLTALHERGVLHRDVKPANVLFRTVESRGGEPQVRAMLADLGLGKAYDMSSRLTMIAGTPSFVAPEQAQGERLDPRADLYALGALTHLLLTGQPPFRHASLSAAAEPGPAPSLSAGGREFGDDVEAVVRRALAPDRDDRWPDVPTYVDALTTALTAAPAIELGPTAGGDHGPLPDPWLPLDPDLTQPGPRPSSFEPQEELPDPAPPRLSRTRARVLLGVAAVVMLVVGAGTGYVAQRSQQGPMELADSTSSLAVTVPHAWTAAVDTGQWTPPDAEGELPALSAGTSEDWASAEAGEGVFIGIITAEDMPEELPGHDGCEAVLAPVSDVEGDDPVLTQASTGCPGVVVERVRQVAVDRYLWVQVRSADRATAYEVLEDVGAPGF
ncbi:MAG: serine/threonine-protein kinase [Nocardioides sp.]